MKFEECVIQKWATGSRYICNPAPTDTDNDTVFLVNGFHPWDDMLKAEGFEPCGDYAGEEFEAYRKGEENYIITEDPEFFLSYVKATEAAKALNLLEKEDRIKLFQTVNRFILKNGKIVDPWISNLVEYNQALAINMINE